MASQAVTTINLQSLPKIASGKVRELFEIDAKTLLFVASDRISAYDVTLENAITDKGMILTLITAHWFRVLAAAVPGLKTHFLTLDPPSCLTPAEAGLVRNRSMQVRRLKVFPIEAVVRGYLAGSVYKEYVVSGTVNGLPMPTGMRLGDAFPGGAMYTPATKAEQGEHDENISIASAAKLVGEKYAARIEELAHQLFRAGSEYALERGIIIADTKFEFGLDEETDEVVLVDEVLTLDSSRFWLRDKYEAGREPESFDKQFVRNWLTKEGLQGQYGVTLPADVVASTVERYQKVFLMLTGKTLEETLSP